MFVLLLCVGVIVGCLLPWQPVVNTRLGHELGSMIWSGFLSFLGGALVLGCLALMQGQVSQKLQKLSHVPLWSLTGGLMGAFFVLASVYLIPRVGATTMSLSFILGQLLMSVAIDHFGWGGLVIKPLELTRILGLVLVLIGIYLVVRPPHAS